MFDEAPIKKTLEDQWKKFHGKSYLLLIIHERRKTDFHVNFKVFEIIKKPKGFLFHAYVLCNTHVFLDAFQIFIWDHP